MVVALIEEEKTARIETSQNSFLISYRLLD